MRKQASLFLFLRCTGSTSLQTTSRIRQRSERRTPTSQPSLHVSSLQQTAPENAPRPSPPSTRRPRFPAKMSTQSTSQSILKISGTAVRTIAAHSKCHDVQPTANPSILAESGPKHPKNMPSSGQSGHIYEKVQKNTPVVLPVPHLRTALDTPTRMRKTQSKEGFLPNGKRVHPNLASTPWERGSLAHSPPLRRTPCPEPHSWQGDCIQLGARLRIASELSSQVGVGQGEVCE